MLSEHELNEIIKRYIVGLESLAKLAKECHLNYSILKKMLIEKQIKIRNKTESLQKYVKYSVCVICGRQFRMRDRWDSTTNHHKKTCGNPICVHTLRSQSNKWDDDRKRYMSELFIGRDTSGWNIPLAEQKPNWKGGYSSKYYRKVVFEVLQIPAICLGCGKKTVSVHHKDRDRMNNIRENIEIYCSSCHTTYHVKKGDIGWSVYNKNIIAKIGVEELKKELASQKSIRTICKEYNTDHHSLNRLIEKYGIENPRKNPKMRRGSKR